MITDEWDYSVFIYFVYAVLNIEFISLILLAGDIRGKPNMRKKNIDSAINNLR